MMETKVYSDFTLYTVFSTKGTSRAYGANR
uniref:Uncharacterized protein n=1 Tax=Rhizophora mucronata TaxID=61149 RepID=A0A2P2NFW3_RHIMU